MSMIDHLAHFLVLVATSDESAATTIARILVERVFSVSSAPETLHSDQGSGFEIEIVK